MNEHASGSAGRQPTDATNEERRTARTTLAPNGLLWIAGPKPVERVREIRDDIRKRVPELLTRHGWEPSQ